jgi:hypothetical protein
MINSGEFVFAPAGETPREETVTRVTVRPSKAIPFNGSFGIYGEPHGRILNVSEKLIPATASEVAAKCGGAHTLNVFITLDFVVDVDGEHHECSTLPMQQQVMRPEWIR